MTQQNFDLIPKVSINPDRINCYSEVKWNIPHVRAKNPFKDNFKDNKTHGKISGAARAKIKKAISYLLFLSTDKALPVNWGGRHYKFKISLVTLTLSSVQRHSDNDIKALFLNQFLVEAKRKWHLKRFVWRAEKQANGNLHFHILCDKFIPWSELRGVWNRIQNKLGYVDRYRDEMRRFHSGGFQVRKDLLNQWSYKQQIKAYKVGKANDWQQPNSTDVHSIRFVSNIKAYITKYLAKSVQSEDVIGRLWGCSYDLSNIKGATTEEDSTITAEISQLIKTYNPNIYNERYFSVIFIDAQTIIRNKCPALISLLAEYLNTAFNFPLQTQF